MSMRKLSRPLPVGLCSIALVLLLAGLRGSWRPRNPPPSREEALPGAEAGGAGRSEAAVGRVTYVRSLKRDGPAARRLDAESLGLECCRDKRKTLRWHIELQPWVSPLHSLEEEAARFLAYISSSQPGRWNFCCGQHYAEWSPKHNNSFWNDSHCHFSPNKH